MAIFNGYVRLPEGISPKNGLVGVLKIFNVYPTWNVYPNQLQIYALEMHKNQGNRTFLLIQEKGKKYAPPKTNMSFLYPFNITVCRYVCIYIYIYV